MKILSILPRAVAMSITTCLVLLATDARADAQADAKDLFEHGRQLRASGDCASALPLFHKAYEIFPGALGPLRNAAECEESVGRWASARRSWLDLKRALLLSQDSKYATWDADADSAAQRLAGRVAHLTIDVSTGGHGNDKLEVTVNGEAFAQTLIGTALDRDPGKYVVRARLASGEPAEQTIDLVTGDTRIVRLVVAPPGQPLPPQPQPKQQTSSAWTPVGAVTLSVGLGAFVGMAVAIGIRQSALSTVTGQCPTLMACSSTLMPVVSRGDAASTAVTVLAVAGGVTAGAGLLMLVLGALEAGSRADTPKGAATAHAGRVAFAVSPVQDGFRAMLSGSFP